MSFQLPGKNKLSKEQLDIINLPTKNSWVIVGGPGTGKTVMAFYRAAQIDSDSEIPLLVYKPFLNYVNRLFALIGHIRCSYHGKKHS